jgi:hypothetical protein
MHIKLLWRFVTAAALLASVASSKAAGKNVKNSICDVFHPGDTEVQWKCFKRPKNKNPQDIWGDKWIEVLRFNRLDRLHFKDLNSLKVPDCLEAIMDYSPVPPAYAPAEQEPKFILIDLDNQFLGAYEYGRLIFSSPVTSGKMMSLTPRGKFRITAFDRRHESTLYPLETSNRPYPMHYGLMFHQSKDGIRYWIHGRDMPGYPGSHGCIGLYDEEMEREYFGESERPVLRDAERLFKWVIEGVQDKGRYQPLKNGPPVEIIGHPPKIQY